MEALETEIQRTRLIGKRLLDLDVLSDMRFDATLPDGRKHSVDGFLAVDQQKMTDLPAEVVYDLHRTGRTGGGAPALGLTRQHAPAPGMACRA